MREELSVIWEIEPGATALDRAQLPALKNFDEPRVFDAFLDAVTWGAVSSADDKALQAPFRSGVEVDDYQLDPVVRAVSMPRVNLLVADDVGLGKTIEAGLVNSGVDPPSPRPQHSDRVSVFDPGAVEGGDARQVRPGVPHR